MAGFDAEKARALFAIPQDYAMGSVTAIGYLGDPNTLPDAMREREVAVRDRKPLNEIVFSAWDSPAKL
jgi:hypothetical protein